MLGRRALAACSALLLTACSTTVTETGGEPPPCPAGSHRVDDTCETTLSWTGTASTSHYRWGHVAFVAHLPEGAFVYLAAGFPYDDIERAAIHADGTLDAFTHVAPFPKLTELSGFVQSGRTLLFVGGMNGDTSLADTLIGTVADDGSIAFTAGPPLGSPRERLTLSVHGGFVYAVGGGLETDGGYPTPADHVERAPFDGTTLGAFEALDPLPMPRMNHSAVVHGDSLYLIGGNDDSPDVLVAPFTADGKLGPFTQVGALISGRSSMAAFTFLDQIYLIGGDGTGSVLRAPVRADATTGVFDQTTPLPGTAWQCLDVPATGTFVYSGTVDNQNEGPPQIFVGKLE